MSQEAGRHKSSSIYKEEEKKIRKAEAKRPKGGLKTGEILVVMYAFIFLFVATIGYFIYYNAAGSKDVINRPGECPYCKASGKNNPGDGSLPQMGRCWPQTVDRCRRKRNPSVSLWKCFCSCGRNFRDQQVRFWRRQMKGDLLLSNINPLTKAFK